MIYLLIGGLGYLAFDFQTNVSYRYSSSPTHIFSCSLVLTFNCRGFVCLVCAVLVVRRVHERTMLTVTAVPALALAYTIVRVCSASYTSYTSSRLHLTNNDALACLCTHTTTLSYVCARACYACSAHFVHMVWCFAVNNTCERSG